MTNYNKRDDRGWRIPREGTKSKKIYNLLNHGYPSQYIIAVIPGDSSSTRVLIHNIKHPESHNKTNNNWYKKNTEAAKAINKKSLMRKEPGKKYSKFVVKLTRVLGISYTEAVELERQELEKMK